MVLSIFNIGAVTATNLFIFVCLLPVTTTAFTPSFSHRLTASPRSLVIRYDYADDGSPSDYDSSDLPSEIKQVAVDEREEDFAIRDALKQELLLLASVTDRGAYCSKDEKDIVIDLVAQLEALNPTKDPAFNCEGEWDLGYSSTQFFRSSPFFQSIRVAVGEDNKDVAENGFALHAQATSGSRVGRVRQIITADKLTSEGVYVLCYLYSYQTWTWIELSIASSSDPNNLVVFLPHELYCKPRRL
uniref:Plastid lipid-associated protein/fibrillin conserved domain-containing protein n=1 Tax=Pseudo-nitzschia australis TaxID=44445 RepID=A0A7S4ADT7_9STRA